MKSGSKQVYKINLEDYEAYHESDDCEGKFVPAVTLNGLYDSSALGPVKLPIIPQFRCAKCGAAVLAEGFNEWIEKILAHNLLISHGSLSKKQIKFLRQHFGFSQEKLGQRLGIDKHEMSKFESSQFSNRVMDIDKQLRLRLIFAELIGIKEIDKLYQLASTKDSAVDVNKIVPTKEEIEQQFPTPKIA